VVITLAAGRRVLRPIRSMTRATQRIAAGDRLARVRIDGNDELARLGAAFNTMADSIEQSERQRQQMVSDVAHELRNPLANVRGYLEGVQDHVVRADGPWVDSLLISKTWPWPTPAAYTSTPRRPMPLRSPRTSSPPTATRPQQLA
jgi:two-component system sensor histidine kinase BaeS